MGRFALTCIGFTSLLVWFCASDYLCLIRDTAAHNESLSVCMTFMVAMLLYALMNRLVAAEPKPRLLLAAGIASSIFLFAYLMCSNDSLRVLFLCLSTGISVLIIVAWGEVLTTFVYRLLLPFVCVCELCAIVVLYCCLLVVSALTPVVLVSAPALCGICLVFLKTTTTPGPAARETDDAETTNASALAPEQTPTQAQAQTPTPKPAHEQNNLTKKHGNDPSTHTSPDNSSPHTKRKFLSQQFSQAARIARSNFATIEPIEYETLHAMPWMLIVVVCLCTFTASLFGGITFYPYLANSHTATATMLVASAVCLAVMGAVSATFFHARQKNNLHRKRQRIEDPLMLLQAIIASVLVVLVCGLLLFALQLPSTMTYALALVFVAKNCFIALCWVLFPRTLADARLPFIPCFALALLASGTFYATYLGVYFSKSLKLSFDTLANIAITLIAFVTLLVITYMIVRIKQTGEESAKAANANEQVHPPTIQDIRDALKAHQLSLMEPYDLTEREKQIVMMIVDGQTFANIGEELFISERTVKFHSKNAYEKLGVSSKKELMHMFSEL